MKIYESHEYTRQLAQKVVPQLRFDRKEALTDWQTRAREKLTELLMLPLESCEDDFQILSETKKDGYRQLDFTFQSEPGYYVSASFLLPDGKTEPGATAICLQGHSTGMHISLGEPKYPKDAASIAGGRDFAVRAVKEGLCAVTMEQRYMGTAGLTENGAPACLGAQQNAAMAALLLGRCAIGERVWDIQRLIDVLFKHFAVYVDPEKLICLGNSGGGTATFYASCMDERIKLSVPSCAVCTFEDSIMAMNHCPCNFIPNIRKFFDMGDLGCLIAPRRLVVVCGEEDPIFPLPGVGKSVALIRESYRAAGKEALCTLVKGRGGHQFYPDDAWPVIHKYLKVM